jgi:hypothetical protein
MGLSFVLCVSNVSHQSRTNGSDRAMSINWAIATASRPPAHAGVHATPGRPGQMQPALVG